MFNAKCTVTRSSAATYNSLGEPLTYTDTTIATNVPCCIELRSRTVMYARSMRSPNAEGQNNRSEYTLAIGANVAVAEGDKVSISGVTYWVILVIPFLPRYKECGLVVER